MDRITRCQRSSEIKLRDDDPNKPRTAVGYASVFNSWTRLGGGKGWEVREIIRPGAFRSALAERQDVRALWNHDANHLLGRTASGTLRLAEDSYGLKVAIDLPATTIGRDVAESLARGDASQMSFAFLPRDGGERTVTRRDGGVDVTEIEITDVDLFDVSIVTYPAYQDTSVELRGGLTDRQRKAVRVAELRGRIRALEATGGGRR